MCNDGRFLTSFERGENCYEFIDQDKKDIKELKSRLKIAWKLLLITRSWDNCDEKCTYFTHSESCKSRSVVIQEINNFVEKLKEVI